VNKIKRKDKEIDKCCLCGIQTTRIINWTGKIKNKRFVCKKCVKNTCG
jgi:hypothetical protein